MQDPKKEIEVFKRPADISTRKRKVLSEEKFAEALDKIIQRECFPDLEKLKAQNAYLDAVANNDIQMMRELTHKYGVGRNTPSITRDANESPSTFETPSSIILSSLNKNLDHEDGSTPSIHLDQSLINQSTSKSDTQSVISGSSTRSKQSSKEPHDMGLNEFLNTYTSEDDQSFQDIVEEGIRKHKIKYAWLYQQEDVHRDLVKNSLALPSISDQQSLDYQRTSNIGTWTYKNKNAVMYIPDGVPMTSEELTEAAKRKPEVAFKHTRFSEKPYKDEKSLETSPAKTLNLIRGMTEGKIGVDGREVNAKTTPSVNGFKLVRTPSPNPGFEESPFLTWGEIEGTPFRLDASDTPVPSTVGAPFRMMESSKRERIALELAEKASKRYRDKKQKTLEVAKSYLTSPSPRPKTSVERMNSMSPAAQRFALTLMKKNDPGTPRTPRL